MPPTFSSAARRRTRLSAAKESSASPGPSAVSGPGFTGVGAGGGVVVGRTREGAEVDAMGHVLKRIEVYTEEADEPSPVLRPPRLRSNAPLVPSSRRERDEEVEFEGEDEGSDESEEDEGDETVREDGRVEEGEEEEEGGDNEEEEDEGDYIVEKAPCPSHAASPPLSVHRSTSQIVHPEFTYPSPHPEPLHTPSRRVLPIFGYPPQQQQEQLTPRSAAAAGLMDKVVGSSGQGSRTSPSGGGGGRRNVSGGSPSRPGFPHAQSQVQQQGRKALNIRRPSGSNPTGSGPDSRSGLVFAGSETEGSFQNGNGNAKRAKSTKGKATQSQVGMNAQGSYSLPAHQTGQQQTGGEMQYGNGNGGHVWYGPPGHHPSGYPLPQHHHVYPFHQQYQPPPPPHGYQQYPQPYPGQYPHAYHQGPPHAMDRGGEDARYGPGGHAIPDGRVERSYPYPYGIPHHAQPLQRQPSYRASPSPRMPNAQLGPSPLLTHTELGKPHFAPPSVPPAHPHEAHAVPMGRSFTSDTYVSQEDAHMHHPDVAMGTIALEHINGRDDAFKTPAGKMIGIGRPGVGVGMMHGYELSSPLDDVSTYQSERSASRPISTPSTARRALGDAYEGTPTRSTTPLSTYSGTESSYQPSTSSARKLKQAYVPSSSIAGDEDQDMDDAEEDEDEYRGSQSSPTRAGKGRGLRSTATLRRGQKLTGEDGFSKKKKGGTKADAKAREAARKAAAGMDAKTSAAATQQAKEEYIPENIPLGPRPADKPPYSYAGLIGQAIMASSKKRLALHQIYAWIMTAYPFFQKDEAGWQNSIRHNLSLNECFVKGDRDVDEATGKGSYWMIEVGAEFQFVNGGFKKHQRSTKDKGGVDGLMLGPGGKSMKPKKRKADEMEDSQADLALSQPMQSSGSGDQASPEEVSDRLSSVTPNPAHAMPLLSDKELVRPSSRGISPMGDVKRPRPEKRMTWTEGHMLGHDLERSSSAPGMVRHFSHSSMLRVGEGGEPDLFQAGPDLGSRRMSNQEGGFSASSNPAMIPRQVPNSALSYSIMPPHYPIGSSPFPGPLREHPAGRSKRMTRFDVEDGFETPQKAMLPPGYPGAAPSSGLSYGMLPPHMTPSASSPATSPSQMPYALEGSAAHLARAYHAGQHPDDHAGKEGFHAPHNQDMGFQYHGANPSDQAEVEPGLQPAAQLVGSFTFATPALPSKARSQMEAEPSSPPRPQQVELIKEESYILSPMQKGHARKKSHLQLPGPGSLLSNASRHSDRDRLEPNGDLLAHLDRVPGSPARGASGLLNGFATPLNKTARTRLITADGVEGSPRGPGIMTPMRSLAAFDHFHVTPAGNNRAQFRAEHGLLESPMGAFGSCYDMSDSGARFDWELQQMTGSRHRRTVSRGDDLVEETIQTPFSLLGSVLARKKTSNMRGNDEEEDDNEGQEIASPTGAGRKKLYMGKALFAGGSP